MDVHTGAVTIVEAERGTGRFGRRCRNDTASCIAYLGRVTHRGTGATMVPVMTKVCTHAVTDLKIFT